MNILLKHFMAEILRNNLPICIRGCYFNIHTDLIRAAAEHAYAADRFAREIAAILT